MHIPEKVEAVRFRRYLTAGALNTVLGYAVFCAAFFLTGVKELAVTISSVLMIWISFHTNHRLVFADRTGIFYRYILVFVAMYLLNLVLLAVFVDHFGIQVYVGQIFVIAVSTGIRFALNTLFVFRDIEES